MKSIQEKSNYLTTPTPNRELQLIYSELLGIWSILDDAGLINWVKKANINVKDTILIDQHTFDETVLIVRPTKIKKLVSKRERLIQLWERKSKLYTIHKNETLKPIE